MNTSLNRIIRSLVFVVFTSMLFVIVGCGEDNKPPDDPAYYTGPMKPKSADATAGGQN